MTRPDGGPIPDFAGLAAEAFGVEPDPESVFVHAGFQKVCADLLISRLSERRGLFLVIGEPGSGKSTLLAKICAERQGVQCCTLLPCQAAPSFDELMTWWSEALGFDDDAGEPERQRGALFEHLARSQETGGTSTLLLDDAEHLEDETLEELCHLAQFERNGRPMVRIVLAARPDLATRLSDPEVEQHIIAFQSRLAAMGPFEVGGYIQRHLDRVGRHEAPVFSPEAIQRIAQVTRGSPRLINGLCHVALLVAARYGHAAVSAVAVEQAIQDGAVEVTPERSAPLAPRCEAGLAKQKPAAPAGRAQGGMWPVSFELDADIPGESAPSGMPRARNAAGLWPQGLRFAAGLVIGVVIGAAGVSFYKAYQGLRENISFEVLLSPREGKLEAIAEAEKTLGPEPSAGSTPITPAAQKADVAAGPDAPEQAEGSPIPWLYELIGWPEPPSESDARPSQSPEKRSHR